MQFNTSADDFVPRARKRLLFLPFSFFHFASFLTAKPAQAKPQTSLESNGVI
jgi:hypothetical protein